MMLPPVDPAILSTHPKFDALYRDLCTNKLHHDGSTAVDEKAQKERDVFSQDLRAVRINAAKRGIVRSELSDLAYRDKSLPEEVWELAAVIAALLNGQIPPEDREIVQEYVDQLVENPSRITQALQDRISQTTTTLSDIVNPKTSPLDLQQQIASLTSSIGTSRSHISQTRLSLAHESTTLHTLYAQVLATSIRLLEQTIHGSVSRASKAHAEYLALVAEGMNKKLGLQHAQLLVQMYSPEVTEYLRERYESTAQEERAVRRRANEAEEVLEKYKAGKGMEGVAKEYAEILRESERVRGEIARLEAKGSGGDP